MLPIEIINYIFRYCQSSTNNIMKNYYVDIEDYGCPLYILTTNKKLGFIHFNKRKYKNAYYYTCDFCNCYLNFDNYTKYYFENLRFCSESCEYKFDSNITLH